MSELGSLFVIVVLVYLIQCIWWINPRSIVFALDFRGRGKRKRQGFVWNALETSGLLANPLPPLSPPLVAHWPAFQLNPDRIEFVPRDEKPVSVSWDNSTFRHSDSRLFCNDVPLFKGSEAQVLECYELLRQLQKLKRAQRGAAIHNWLRKGMSAQTVGRKAQVFHARSRWLRVVANLQFFILFLLVPLAFSRFGLGILWRLVAVVVVMSVAVTLEFWTLHKTFFPKAKGTRLKHGFMTLLSPLAAIRATDVVARDLLSSYHPLAVAGAVLPQEEFRKFAGEQLRLCRLGGHSDTWYREAMEKAMEQALRQKGVSRAEVMRPPEQEGGCVIYCPRCLAQYTKERQECSDCGYEKLEPFARSLAVN